MLAWLLILVLTQLAHGGDAVGHAVSLPSGEDPALWSAPLRLAGLRASEVGEAGVAIVAVPGGWEVRALGEDGAHRRAVVPAGDRVASREDAAYLAASLAEELARVSDGEPDEVVALDHAPVPPVPTPALATPSPVPSAPPPQVELAEEAAPAPPSVLLELPPPPPPATGEIDAAVLEPSAEEEPAPDGLVPPPPRASEAPEISEEAQDASPARQVLPIVGLAPFMTARSGVEAGLGIGAQLRTGGDGRPFAALRLGWTQPRDLLSIQVEGSMSALDLEAAVGLDRLGAQAGGPQALVLGGVSCRWWRQDGELLSRTHQPLVGLGAGWMFLLESGLSITPALHTEADLGTTLLEVGGREPVPLGPYQVRIVLDVDLRP